MQNTEVTIDSSSPFRRYYLTWKILGLNDDGSRTFGDVYRYFVFIAFTLVFPLHLLIGVFNTSTEAELFAGLTINACLQSCLLKNLAFLWNFKKMKQLYGIFSELDKRADSADERDYLTGVIRLATLMVNTMFVMYAIPFCCMTIGLIVSSNRILIYPGWVPFDWHGPLINYIGIAVYQDMALFQQCVQNLSNDLYVPVLLCMFAGHTHALRLRLAKVGYDETKTVEENNKDLIDCVYDYNKLMEIYKLTKETISLAMLIQFLGISLNIGLGVVNIVFFSDAIAVLLYNIFQVFGVFGELLPFCYFGSVACDEFELLPYAIFSTNWINQSKMFRQNVVLFSEFAAREIIVVAGGFVRIHVNAFIATVKMAYSLFTLVQQMK